MVGKCPKCGKKNEGWKFCPNCGAELKEAPDLEESLGNAFQYFSLMDDDDDFDDDFDDDEYYDYKSSSLQRTFETLAAVASKAEAQKRQEKTDKEKKSAPAKKNEEPKKKEEKRLTGEAYLTSEFQKAKAYFDDFFNSAEEDFQAASDALEKSQKSADKTDVERVADTDPKANPKK